MSEAAEISIHPELANIAKAFSELRAERDRAERWSERRAAWLDEERASFDRVAKIRFGEGFGAGALAIAVAAIFVWALRLA